jgi:hypothetical protein
VNFAISSTPAASVAVSMRAPPAKAVKLPVDEAVAKKAAEQLAAAKKVGEDFRAARQDVRDQAKARAREKVQRLRDELKLLAKLLAGNPKEFARQVARIAKELRAAFKEFAQAHKGDVQDATVQREAAANDAAEKAASAKAVDEEPAGEDATDAAAKETSVEQKPASGYATATVEPRTVEERRRAAGIEDTPEAKEMKDFIREVRGMLKKLREMLQEAKVKGGETARKQPGEKTDPFEDAEKELKELDKDLDRALQDVSAEAKLAPVQAGAFVLVTA